MRIYQTAAAITVERFLAFLGKPIDVLLIYIIATWGVVEGFVVGLAIEMAISIIVLELHLYSSKKGFEVTGAELVLDYIRSPVPENLSKGRQMLSRAIKATLQKTIGSYPLMILVGSVIYIESDYATILLRRPNEGRVSVIFRVTLPAAAWSTAVWVALFWAAIEGYRWAAPLVL